MEKITDELAEILETLNCDLIKRKIDYACYSRYGDAESFCKKHKNKLSENSYTIDDSGYRDNSCYVTTKDFEKKPTLSEVKDWFITEGKIHITIDCTLIGNEYYAWLILRNARYPIFLKNEETGETKVYKTYEECLENVILFAITQLK